MVATVEESSQYASFALSSTCEWGHILALLSLVLAIYALYLRYLHPYRDVPGPFLATISPFWKVRAALKGTFYKDITSGHERYGKILRIAPDEVSISDPEAIKQIYGHAAKFTKVLLIFFTTEIKTDFYTTWENQNNPSMFTYTDEIAHAAERRLVANAYSLTSLLQLETFVDQTILQFSRRLEDFSNSRTGIDMVFWLHAFAFDVVGELGFGKSFGFLASGSDVNAQMAYSKEWLRKRFAISMTPWFFPIFRSPLFAILSPAGQREKENETLRNEVCTR